MTLQRLIQTYEKLSFVLALQSNNNISECLLLLFVVATLLATLHCWGAYLVIIVIILLSARAYLVIIVSLHQLRLKHLVTEASLPLYTKSKHYHRHYRQKPYTPDFSVQ